MPLISVIIITKNEAYNIEACLQSVTWADEIIVVDSGSTDETVELCRHYTNKILVTDWPGYGIQKQRALEMATGEWVLSIDADERVTPELKQEILSTIPKTTNNGFEIPFISEYCGKLIRFGDWWNDRQVVFFRRTKACFTSSLVHERIEVEGTIGKLKKPIYHLAFRDLSMVLRKMNDYSTWSAEQKKLLGQKGGVWKAISHGLWAFFRGYFLRLGFLDGKEGFLLAVSNAEGTYYRYLKLSYLI
jgi:glycosyltransferase involved in cell wall biosynthesis